MLSSIPTPGGRMPDLDAAQHLERAAVLNHREGRRGIHFYHGGPLGIKRGAQILSPRETGIRNLEGLGPPRDLRKVYVSEYALESLRYAAAFRWADHGGSQRKKALLRGGALYEVKPVGELEPDPDFDYDLGALYGRAGLAWQVPSAVMLRQIQFGRVDLLGLSKFAIDIAEGSDAAEAASGLRPFVRREAIKFADSRPGAPPKWIGLALHIAVSLNLLLQGVQPPPFPNETEVSAALRAAELERSNG